MTSDSLMTEEGSVSSEPSPDAKPGEVTILLSAWSRGDAQAREELFGLVYPELHRIASRSLARQPPPIGFESEDLLHDAYLRLAEQRTSWQNRGHFFATVAKLVRRVVADHIKQVRRLKRGNGSAHASLDDVELPGPPPDLDGLAVHQVLAKLSAADPTAARVVALRYFEGLSLDEVAEALQLGRATVVRSWSFARAFLSRGLRRA